MAGRNLLDNVISIDSTMHILSTLCMDNGLDPAAIFFDFMAAFPSVAHAYLWAVLAAIGRPTQFIAEIKKVYQFNKHLIKIAGTKFDGPTILAGVRQGCPLSMLLFALAIWPLLIMLERTVDANGDVGCFADDVAVVVSSLRNSLLKLYELFHQFELASGLALNLDKNVIIPLWESPGNCNLIEASACVRAHVPQWSKFKVQLHTEFQGFVIGPGATNIMWNSILRKAADTAIRWRNLHLGFFFSLIACNIYILPLFSYVGQLARCTKEVVTFSEWLKCFLFHWPRQLVAGSYSL